MKITYIEKGVPFDFKRIDCVQTVNVSRTWKSGGLLYGYKDRYNVVAIATEDILKIEE